MSAVAALFKPNPPSDVPLRCRCGHVRGVAIGLSSSSGFRFVCYCKDCQAFARFLGRADVLDGAGGTDIFQMPPGHVTLSSGLDAMRCLRLSPRSRVLRWYADCCSDPIGNTAASPRFPIVAIIHSFMDHEGRPRDDVLGAPLCGIYERSAVGPLPTNAPPPPSLRVFGRRASKLLGWLVRGLNRPTPFFDDRTKVPSASTGDAKDKKGFWTKIGVALENRDGSWTLLFEYLPARMAETTIQLRPFNPKTEKNAPRAEG